MKQVMITGADRGIGLALCKSFLQHGWRVFAGRFMKDWKELEDLLKEYPKRLTLVDLDVGKSSSVQRAAEQVQAEKRQFVP